MKNRFFIIILIQILLLNYSYSFAQNFAPLNLGNTWYWENEWNVRGKSTVIDTNYFFNDKYYRKILHQTSNNDIYTNLSYFNSKDSLLYMYTPPLPPEPDLDVVYYKLHCALGDTFSSPLMQNVVLTYEVINAYQAQVFDTIVTIKILLRSAGGLVDHLEAWTDEFGKLGTTSFYYNLRGCIINGKVYGDTTTVGIEDEPRILSNFKLFQNYPNPFNPTTKIQYEINGYTLVTLKVFDILGNEIAVLVNEEKQAGKYSTIFNGKGLSSGIYFYKLSIGGKTEVRKMILLQ